MDNLSAHFEVHEYSPAGTQAWIRLREFNGDEYRVRCLCRNDGTTDFGTTSPSEMEYLVRRYGWELVCHLARRATLTWS